MSTGGNTWDFAYGWKVFTLWAQDFGLVGPDRRSNAPLFPFPLLSYTTGLAGGLLSRILIRSVSGCTEDAFTPAIVYTTSEAPHPKRLRLNQELQLGIFALVGVTFGILGALFLWETAPHKRHPGGCAAVAAGHIS
jgi:hypothetical protein